MRSDVERNLIQALQYLSGLCDGAIQQDGVGFNGADTEFGRSLAERSYLTDNQLFSAWKMLQKYRGQLAVVAIELPTEKQLNLALIEDSVPTRIAVGSAAVAIKSRPVKRIGVAEVVEVDILVEKPWLKSEFRIGLSEQQQEAFDSAHEWFFSKPDQPFVLIGRAGSGKSFTAQRIAQSLKKLSKKPLKIALTAPTHRARAVLEKFAAEADLHCHISTMQSLLYLKPGKANKDGKRKLEVNEFKWRKRDRDPHWSDFDLIVNDECSMISTELFNYVTAEKTPVLFMGESYQLPPVEGDEDDCEEKLSPVFDLACGVKLTKVMRYDGQIAKYVDSIATKIESGEKFLPKLSNFESRDGNLFKISSREAWESIMLETFKDSENCRAIAWTNKQVNYLNELIRTAVMGFTVAQVPFEIGDRVMAKEPIIQEEFDHEWFSWRESSLMQTCDEGEIIEVSHGIRVIDAERDSKICNFSAHEIKAIEEVWGSTKIPVTMLTVACESGDVITVQVVTREVKKAIEFAYTLLKKRAGSEQNEDDRKALWRAYFHLLDAFHLTDRGEALQRLQFAFASTCHHSQGGTYDYVFSDHSNLMGCKNPFIRDRLIYTASSRAAKQLIAYSKY